MQKLLLLVIPSVIHKAFILKIYGIGNKKFQLYFIISIYLRKALSFI